MMILHFLHRRHRLSIVHQQVEGLLKMKCSHPRLVRYLPERTGQISLDFLNPRVVEMLRMYLFLPIGQNPRKNLFQRLFLPPHQSGDEVLGRWPRLVWEQVRAL
jgi:hypothetical protein